MAEETKKPRTLWESALKVVKGDSAEQLVEQFTAEMTLVAEGLYDDQARLRHEVEQLRMEQGKTHGYLAILYLLLGVFGLSIISYALIQSELNEYAA